MSRSIHSLDRRSALKFIGAVAATVASIPLCSSASSGDWPLRSGIAGIDEQHLWIRQVGKSEAVHTRFRFDDGQPDLNGVADLSWLFRDWRDADQHHWIDVRLFDLLASIQTFTSYIYGQPTELVLNSGYRTRRRNATIEGAAANSQHIHGRAADVTMTDVPHQDIRDAAEAAGANGIGRYPSFTHLDVGPGGRRWRG